MSIKTWGPLAATLAMAVAAPVAAQDAAKVAPDNYRCTFENAHARLCEVTIPKGAKIPTHSHPAHLIHVLTPGTMKLTDDTTGKVEILDMKAGQDVWVPAVTHHGENVGDTDMKAILVEFRDLKK